MDRKLWLSIIAAMIGASLLVAAATAAPAKNQASKTKHATKGGTFVVEFLLQLPGLGYELVVAINQDDYLVVQGIVLVIAVAVVVLNVLVDFLFTVVDPRISLD